MPGPYIVGDNVTFDVAEFTIYRNKNGKYGFVADIEFFKDGAAQPYRTSQVESTDFGANLDSTSRTQIDQALQFSMAWLESKL